MRTLVGTPDPGPDRRASQFIVLHGTTSSIHPGLTVTFRSPLATTIGNTSTSYRTLSWR